MGAPRVVVIAGEPGIGKTRLAEECLNRARESGTRVVTCASWDLGAPALWPWIQGVRALVKDESDSELSATLPNSLPVLATLVPELRTRFALVEQTLPSETREARFMLFDAVVAFLAWASRRPVAFMFDDLHAADVNTVALLRFVLRDPRVTGLSVLATVRTTGFSTPAEVASEIAALCRLGSQIELGGLDASALIGLLGPDAGADAQALAAHTAGNPLFIDGLLRVGWTGASAGRARPSHDVRDLIASRVGSLVESARQTVLAAAVVGRPSSLGLLARVAESSLAVVANDVGVACEAGLLRRTGELGLVTFFHPLVAEVIYDGLTEVVRIDLHRRVGVALEQVFGGTDPLHIGELSRHFLEAAVSDGLERALTYSRSAAECASRAGAFEEAARIWTRVLEVSEGSLDDPEARASVLLALGEAQLAAGQRERARRTLERALEVAVSPEQLTVAALAYARTFEFGIADDRRIFALRRALERVPHLSPMVSQLQAQLAMELWTEPSSLSERTELATAAVKNARSLGDEQTLEVALKASLFAVWEPEGTADRLDVTDELLGLASRSASPSRLLEAHRLRMNVLLEVGRTEEAFREIDAYCAVARRLVSPQPRANALLREVLPHQMAGRWAEALEIGLRSRDAMRRADDPQADVVWMSRTVMFAVLTDDRSMLQEVLPPYLEAARARASFVLYGAIALHGLIAAGQHEVAGREWERIRARGLADVGRDLMTAATLSLLAEPVVAIGTDADCALLLDRLAPYRGLHATIGATYSHGSVARYVGLLLARLGRGAEAVLALEEAVSHNKRLGAVQFVALAAADRVRVQSGCEVAVRPGAHADSLRSSPVGCAVLRCEGDVWLVACDGVQGRVKASRGLMYVHQLVSTPGTDIHVLALVGAVGAVGMTDSSAAPVLDARARQAYRDRAESLREDLQEAEQRGDLGRATRLREELDALGEELARAVGLGGRDRRAAGAVERARGAVTKAISRAIEQITRVVPTLGAHLAHAVRTGTSCRYAPDPRAALAWDLVEKGPR